MYYRDCALLTKIAYQSANTGNQHKLEETQLSPVHINTQIGIKIFFWHSSGLAKSLGPSVAVTSMLNIFNFTMP